jgi:hypothetical protein
VTSYREALVLELDGILKDIEMQTGEETDFAYLEGWRKSLMWAIKEYDRRSNNETN